MPDSKITALASIGTGTDPAVDPLVIVDVSDTTMAASGTTKKVTLNNLLASSPTAGGNFTITGNLTVDTNTFFVGSANNRVGVGTVSPGKGCEINQSANAITTIGAGEILRLIGDDGNTIGRITEIGFGTGPTGAVYAPVTLGVINTSIAGFNHKAFYIATRTGTGDDAPVERYRIANDGVATWSNVGGVAGTAMTLNSTGLGVGGSPTRKLSIVGSAVATYANINSGDNTSLVGLLLGGTSAPSAGQVIYNNTDNSMGLYTAGAVKLTIDTSGNVGIGVTPSGTIYSSSETRFVVKGTAANYVGTVAVQSNGTTNAVTGFLTAGDGVNEVAIGSTTNTPITFFTNNVRKATIDTSGNLILQPSTTPPTLTTNGQLTVNATSNTNLRFSYRGSDGVTRVADITLA